MMTKLKRYRIKFIATSSIQSSLYKELNFLGYSSAKEQIVVKKYIYLFYNVWNLRNAVWYIGVK